jgi:hypothetical protein
MMPAPSPILEDFLNSGSVSGLSAWQWDLLIRQARRANLLARLAWLLQTKGLADLVPEVAKPHLQSATIIAQRQDIAIHWEVNCIRAALSGTGVPVVLLKGAAYVLAGLPAAKGRVFSDVDIIVPRDAIPAVESALLLNGWRHHHLDAYDQRYYRKWMHEIPPMEHVRRGTVIDVHHSILPDTARIRTNAAAILEASVPVAGHDGIRVLSPTDMVLHSATHLFHEGELHNGLRDLVDLDSLLRHFSESPDFWPRIVARAQHLGLSRPLYYALRYTKGLLGTPIPQTVIDRVTGPPSVVRKLMDFCYRRALRPDHASCTDAWTPLARLALYIRSHWIRMPFLLLVYHLARKALVAGHDGNEDQAKPDPGNQPAG